MTNDTILDRAMKDSMLGLIGDNISDIDAGVLYTRVCNRYGIYAPSWSVFVDLARKHGVRFADYNRAFLPKRLGLYK
jgi:hypothetical protein